VTIAIWARPPVPLALFCAVVRVDRGSIVTHCRGRWEQSERDEIRWRAPKGQRCGGCAAEVDRLAMIGANQTTAANRSPREKFKIGDRVKLSDEYVASLRAGGRRWAAHRAGRVVGFSSSRVRVIRDGFHSGSDWDPVHWETVADALEAP
jgi:hypothetical protein